MDASLNSEHESGLVIADSFVTDFILGKYMRAVKSATEDYWVGGNKLLFTRLVSVSI